MNRKSSTISFGMFVLAVFIGAVCAPTISAATLNEHATSNKPIGLNGQDSAAQNHLVALKPQTNQVLLERKATELGPHTADSMLQLSVSLKLRNVRKLRQFLRDVQDPGSSDYHRFLTPAQFTARYGPSKEDIQTVVRFLELHGVRIRSISPNRLLIHTEATTATYEHAFAIRINDYRLNGRVFSVPKTTRSYPNPLPD